MSPCQRIIAATLVALAASSVVHARPLRDNEVIYFTDKTAHAIAGHFMMYCSGEHDFEGKTTPFWVRYQSVCEEAHLKDIGPGCYLDGTYQSCDQEWLLEACSVSSGSFCTTPTHWSRKESK